MYNTLREAAKKAGIKKIGERTGLLRKCREKRLEICASAGT